MDAGSPAPRPTPAIGVRRPFRPSSLPNLLPLSMPSPLQPIEMKRPGATRPNYSAPLRVSAVTPPQTYSSSWPAILG